MVRRWVCGVVVVAVVFGLLGWSAPAMANRPDDYILLEFVPAELGAIAGGFLGLMTGWAVAQGAGLADKAFYDWPELNKDISLAGWGMGRSLGASVGVTWVGESLGVQGNVLMAYLLPGVMLSLWPIAALLGIDRDTDPPPYGVSPDAVGYTDSPWLGVIQGIYLPFVPAALAVIGFNIGAKMKDTGQPASLPWNLDLPVLSLEF